VQAAITRRVTDEGRRDELKAEAERLNPDGWVTDEEVSAGLEQYEAVLASLRDVIGRRRRRRGGRNAPPASAGGPVESPPETTPEVVTDGEDEEPGSEI
jgi:hypothetical protein